jgi:outer membrane protein OmpA-like peptidoglycan-associated protein
VQEINARYELLQQGEYLNNIDRSALKPVTFSANVPLELHEARNAVQIAGFANANRYASSSFEKAQRLLKQAEEYQGRKLRKPAIMTAREAVQTAEDARVIAVRRAEEERLAEERRIAAERQAGAKARAEEEARLRGLAEEQQRAEAERRARAEAESLQSQLAAERAARERAEAEAARLAALKQEAAMREQAERARSAAEESERQRLQAEEEKEALRRRLLEQLNAVLDTRDTERGVVVNMSDVLFDLNRFALRPIAREKLARISGIVLAYPGLQLEIEGHTDATGTDDYNMQLSEKRAASVREYLVQQGIPEESTLVRGLGESAPIADNSSAKGRQLNRRVEIVVSGEAIGVKLGSFRQPQATSPQ